MKSGAQDPSHHVVRFGSAEIPFKLTQSHRKSLKIIVSPDQQVTVEAPGDCPLEEVLERVQKRGGWIVRQFEYVRRFQPLPTPRRYISGETHLYLGRQYRLKVIQANQEAVKLIRGYFQVYVRDTKDTAKVKRLLGRWFNVHARAVITARLKQCYTTLKHFDVPPPQGVVFRGMEKRWGSCTKAGTILLNTELAHVPVSSIDYVVTHELCHLKHPNHSPAFYALLTQVMPDWKKRKEHLERALQ